MLFFFLHWFSFFLKSHCHKTESTMTSEAGKVSGPCTGLCLLLLDLFCSQRLVQRRNNTSCLFLPLLIIEHDIFPMANNHMYALSERDNYVPVIETHPPFSPSSIKLLCYSIGTDSNLNSPWNGLILSLIHTHTYNSSFDLFPGEPMATPSVPPRNLRWDWARLNDLGRCLAKWVTLSASSVKLEKGNFENLARNLVLITN